MNQQILVPEVELKGQAEFQVAVLFMPPQASQVPGNCGIVGFQVDASFPPSTARGGMQNPKR